MEPLPYLCGQAPASVITCLPGLHLSLKCSMIWSCQQVIQGTVDRRSGLIAQVVHMTPPGPMFCQFGLEIVLHQVLSSIKLVAGPVPWNSNRVLGSSMNGSVGAVKPVVYRTLLLMRASQM